MSTHTSQKTNYYVVDGDAFAVIAWHGDENGKLVGLVAGEVEGELEVRGFVLSKSGKSEQWYSCYGSPALAHDTWQDSEGEAASHLIDDATRSMVDEIFDRFYISYADDNPGVELSPKTEHLLIEDLDNNVLAVPNWVLDKALTVEKNGRRFKVLKHINGDEASLRKIVRLSGLADDVLLPL